MFVLALCCLIAFAVAEQGLDINAEWDGFKTTYLKTYESKREELHRKNVFIQNLKFVKSHDAEKTGFTVAMNEFGDMTNDEFTSRFNGLNINITHSTAQVREVITEEVADTVDWRTKGAVTPIKNQGQCGSCWSFSATGSIEGATFLKTGKLPNLSEQNLVDCSTAQGNQGCNGGLMDDAFKYVISNHGIDSEASYPYKATGPNTCEFKSQSVAATISSYHDIPTGDENALKTAVAKTPVSVAIDASHLSFQFYSGGVYYSYLCSSSALDHGVLAVGYGTDSGKDYWLVKNSWGTSWGLEGYIMLSRNQNNNCGIATSASYPIV